MKIPELLLPAGSFEKMKYAFAYGADAVYAGVPQYSLRARENDFTIETTGQAIEYARSLDKKIYLTMNIYPHNRKINGFIKMLDRVAELNPDGLIMADPGMIAAARRRHPQLPVHLSTQANTLNYETVKFWRDWGVRRIILSRELSLDEISAMRKAVPDIELEAFIHGAICIAYSGRCLLSNYFTHRDANQGACTNACRWQYQVYSDGDNRRDTDYVPLTGQYFIEESERKGSLMPVDEDEHGTYIMNAKDLATINILDEMVAAGLDSLKVEGRTKSVYYLSVITRAYRKALDALAAGESVPKSVKDEVYAVANRGYITGFLERNPLEKGQNYDDSHSDNQTRIFAGIIDGWDEKQSMADVRVRNRFERGDTLEIFSPEGIIPFTVEAMFDMDLQKIDTAHGGGKDIKLPLPQKPAPFALLRKKIES